MDAGGFNVGFYATATKALPSRIKSDSGPYAAIPRYGKPISSMVSYQIRKRMDNSESTNTGPPEKAANVETTGEAIPIIAEADLMTALEQLLQEHELDQNFPRIS